MKISYEKLAELKSFENLLAYCQSNLGAPKKVGSRLRFPCPFGSHSSQKFEVSEYKGVGVGKCWACDKSADIFGIEKELNGGSFADNVKAVASFLSIAIDDEPRENYTPKRKKMIELAPREEDTLDQATQDAILATLDTQKQPLAIREKLAGELGLDASIFDYHSREVAALNGGLGITPKGSLLYVFSHIDESGKLIIDGAKQRASRGSVFETVKNGEWTSGGILTRRFNFVAGKPRFLWGHEGIEQSCFVIVTEGESDALAISLSRESYRQMFFDNHACPEKWTKAKNIPAIVAKPSAGAFKKEWAEALKDKIVILCVDNDEAGRAGAAKTEKILLASGVKRVYLWHALNGKKDARSMYNKNEKAELFKLIFDSTK